MKIKTKKISKKIKKLFKNNKKIFLALVVFLVILFGASFQNNLKQKAFGYFVSKGNYYYNGGAYDTQKAERMYNLALKVKPESDFSYYQLARISFVEGNFDLALERIDKALELNPENKRAFYIRGLIDGYAGRYTDAIEDFKKFVQWSPFEWAGYNDLAWAYFENGEYEKVRETAQMGLDKTDPENAWLLNGLGVAYLNLGESKKAEEIFEKVKVLAQNMPVEKWVSAYPGNDPGTAEWNLEKFKTDIGANSKLAAAGFSSGGIYADACSSSLYWCCYIDQTCRNQGYFDPDHYAVLDMCPLWSWGRDGGLGNCPSPNPCAPPPPPPPPCVPNCSDSGSFCSGTPYTGNCGQGCSGTAVCCTDSTWGPDPSTICAGISFTQTSNCGNIRLATGTKNPVYTKVCDLSGGTTCDNSNCGQTLTRTATCLDIPTNGCGSTQPASGCTDCEDGTVTCPPCSWKEVPSS